MSFAGAFAPYTKNEWRIKNTHNLYSMDGVAFGMVTPTSVET